LQPWRFLGIDWPWPRRRIRIPHQLQRRKTHDEITTKDGTQIYYKDWGTGQPIVFHTVGADRGRLDAQMLFSGSTAIASSPMTGVGMGALPDVGRNEMDT